jgi:hypothetical protein
VLGGAAASARASISDEPADVAHPPSEKLDSTSAAAANAVIFVSFDIPLDIQPRRSLSGEHCGPIMTIAGRASNAIETYPAPGAAANGAPPTETGPTGSGSRDDFLRDVATDRTRAFDRWTDDVVSGSAAFWRESTRAISEET